MQWSTHLGLKNVRNALLVFQLYAVTRTQKILHYSTQKTVEVWPVTHLKSRLCAVTQKDVFAINILQGFRRDHDYWWQRMALPRMIRFSQSYIITCSTQNLQKIRLLLERMIAKEYTKFGLYHWGKQHTASISGTKVRKSFNRFISNISNLCILRHFLDKMTSSV